MQPLISRGVDLLAIAIGAWLTHGYWLGTADGWPHADVFLTGFNCASALVLFPSMGLYSSWRGKPIAELVARVLVVWVIVLTLGVVVAFTAQRTEEISRGWVVSWAVVTGLLLAITKIALYSFLQRIRRSGLNQKAVAVVGPSAQSEALIAQIRRQPQAGFRALCVLDEQGHEPRHEQWDEPRAQSRSDAGNGPSTLALPQIAGVPVLTDLSDLARMVRQRHVQEIWLAMPLSEERNIMRYVREFRNDFVDIRFIPDIRSLTLFNHSIGDVVGLPAICLTATTRADLHILPKLIFDRVFAALVLLMLAPLLLGIAIAVKRSSSGPVFFKQRRKGMDGREFEIYKFRSMKVHVEAHGVVTQAQKSDPRVTRVGAFLRKTSLDELPQFINVLKGDMSVVGPRPHAIAHDDLYKDQVEGYMYRYRIKPGITGWAQVNGFRGETDRIEKMAGRVKYDLYYIQNCDFWFDIKIVLMTIIKGFIGKNAY